MRITYRHGVEDWDGSVTQEGYLRVTGRVGPLPVEVLVHPWDALPGAICAVPLRVVHPVRCEARLVVTDEEIQVDLSDSRLAFLKPILKPVVKWFLGSRGWQVTPAPGRPGE